MQIQASVHDGQPQRRLYRQYIATKPVVKFVGVYLSETPLCIFMSAQGTVNVHIQNQAFSQFQQLAEIRSPIQEQRMVFVLNSGVVQLYEYDRQIAANNFNQRVISKVLHIESPTKQKPAFIELIDGTKNKYVLVVLRDAQQNYEIQVFKINNFSSYVCKFGQPQGYQVLKVKSQYVYKDNESKKLQTYIGVLYMFQQSTHFKLYKFDDTYHEEKQYLIEVHYSNAQQQQQKEMVYDFTFLYPKLGNNKYDDPKLVWIEGDRFNIQKLTSGLQKNRLDRIERRQHGRLLITAVKSLNNYIVCGDISKGIIIYSMDDQNRIMQCIDRIAHDIQVRDLEIGQSMDGQQLRILTTCQQENLYIYNLSQERMEKTGDFHVGTKINKIIRIESSTNDKFWAIGNDGSWFDIKFVADLEIKEILTNLQKQIFEELPFLAGSNPFQSHNIQTTVIDNRIRQRKGFVEQKIIDLFLNLSRPLQRVISSKLGMSRQKIIQDLGIIISQR